MLEDYSRWLPNLLSQKVGFMKLSQRDKQKEPISQLFRSILIETQMKHYWAQYHFNSFFLFFGFAPGVRAPTNPGGANALGKEFPASAPRLIQILPRPMALKIVCTQWVSKGSSLLIVGIRSITMFQDERSMWVNNTTLTGAINTFRFKSNKIQRKTETDDTSVITKLFY